MFELVPPSHGHANAVTLTDLHKNMGHAYRKSILRAINKGHTTGLPADLDLTAPEEPCDGCDQRGPTRKAKKPKATVTRASRYGERSLADLAVVNEPSRGGHKYYLVCVDDWNREGTVYLLRRKSDCIEAMQRHRKMVENQTGRELTYFRSDNESSFISKEFARILQEAGIQHELSTPGNSFQNGVAERRIGTLDRSFTAARALAGAPIGFWGEGIHYTNFLWNRIGTSANPDGVSPLQRRLNKPTSWAGNHPWGCEVWPKLDGRKFDVKSTRCCLLGVAEDSPDGKHRKCYRLWDIANQRVLLSRDVLFKDKVFPWKERKSGVAKSSNPIPVDVQSFLLEQEPIPTSSQVDDAQLVVSAVPEPTPAPESKSVPESKSPVPEPEIMQRKSGRSIRPPARFAHAVTSTAPKQTGRLPRNYREAESSPDAEYYLRACDAEMAKLIERETFSELVDLPPGRRAHNLRFVFKWKAGDGLTEDGSAALNPVKARLVFGGHTQVKDIDYDESSSPTVNMKSIRLLLALRAQYGVKVCHLDAVSAFTNAEMEEELYCKQASGYEVEGQEHKVRRLLQSLYGCVQSNRNWWKLILRLLMDENFEQCVVDECIFILRCVDQPPVIVALFVDDFYLLCGDDALTTRILSALNSQFEITDLGFLESSLGLRVHQDLEAGTVTIDQERYVDTILAEFGMTNCNAVATPSTGEPLTQVMCPQTPEEKAMHADLKVRYDRGVGMALYVQRMTRPDISYPVRELCKFTGNPGKKHEQALLRLFRFLKGSKSLGITYSKSPGRAQLSAYCDSDFANDKESRRSVTGWVTFLCGGPISWKSESQSRTALLLRQSTSPPLRLPARSTTR